MGFMRTDLLQDIGCREGRFLKPERGRQIGEASGPALGRPTREDSNQGTTLHPVTPPEETSSPSQEKE